MDRDVIEMEDIAIKELDLLLRFWGYSFGENIDNFFQSFKLDDTVYEEVIF